MKGVKQSNSRVHKVKEKILDQDLFKAQMPKFGLSGKESQASWCGTVVSLIILALMLIYAWLKFEVLMNRSNPQVSTTEEKSALDETDVLNLNSSKLRFAFHAENFENEPVMDPRYVKFIVLINTMSEGWLTETPVSFHDCSEAELREFSPPSLDA